MMTTEEKAKAYDEALKVLHKYDGANIMFTQDLKEEMFPELAESEDERIKKEIISAVNIYCSEYSRGTKVKEDMLAWLEKQGKKKLADKVEPKFKVGDYIERKDGLGCHAKIIFVGKNVYGCEKLIYSEDESPFFEFMFENQDEFLISSDFEQKPADKVEHKFKVGDWIIGKATTNEPRQISEITDQYYKSTYGGQYGFSFEDEMHLWTIKDAMDCDVLQLGEVTAIFKEFIGNGNCRCYCSVCNGEFEIPSQDGADNCYGCHNTTPATKERREQLEKAMTDAGYIFDFEKKELKKIEQKPAWSEEDKQYLLVCKNALYKYQSSDQWDAGIIIRWLENKLKCSVFQQQEREWSEEDDEIIHSIEQCIYDNVTNIGTINKVRYVDWLKSLKDRFTWKPSEEQREIVNN